jgi:2OG-Fe(II) oxygenase superfamily
MADGKPFKKQKISNRNIGDKSTGFGKTSSIFKTCSVREKSSMSSWMAGQPVKCLTAVEKELSSTQYAPCPICNISLSVRMMNLHLDSCLGPVKEFTSKKLSTTIEIDLAGYPPDDVTLPTPTLIPFEHPELPGLWLFHEFITEEEERSMVSDLDNDETSWHLSTFNGHCLSKSFGLKTQFGPAHVEERIVRRNDPTKGERDIPDYLLPFVDRLRTFVKNYSKKFKLPAVLNSFLPNECNANCYLKSENHSLTPHYDDRFLSGPILMNLSLNGCSKMTYTKGNSEAVHDTVKVTLPRRCLQLVTGDARYKYKHRINAEDVVDQKRMSVTWRQAGDSNGGLIRGQVKSGPSSSLESYLIP